MIGLSWIIDCGPDGGVANNELKQAPDGAKVSKATLEAFYEYKKDEPDCAPFWGIKHHFEGRNLDSVSHKHGFAILHFSECVYEIDGENVPVDVAIPESELSVVCCDYNF